MGLHFGRSTKIFLKTLPYIAIRTVIGIVFAIITLIYFAFIGGLFALAGWLNSTVAFYVVFFIFLLTSGILLAAIRFARKYLLYLVSAGHIAVIAHIIKHDETPDSQISYGREIVQEEFKEMSALFVLDQLIKSVLNQFNRAVMSFANLIDFVPTLENIVNFLRRVLTLAGNHLDEAIIAHIFMEEEKGKWTAARDGLVLYAKVWKSILASAMILIVGVYVAQFAYIFLFGGVAVLVVSRAAWWLALMVLGVVVAFGMVIQFGVANPYMKTVLITTFLIESEDETPDSDTMDFIEEKSSKFKEIVENAADEKLGDDSDSDDEPPVTEEESGSSGDTPAA